MHAASPSPAPSIQKLLDRRWRVLLAAILILALGARVAMMLGLRASVYADFLFSDERTYDRWARSIVEGRPFYVYSVSPLPAYVMAAVYRVLGPEHLYARVLNTGLDLGTCAWLFFIGRRIAGTAAGLGAALIGALYQPFVLFGATLLKESLGLFLFGAAVALALSDRESPAPWRALILGCVGGLLANVRQNAVVVVLLLVAWTVLGRKRRGKAWRAPALAAVLACSGFAAVTTPFAIANLEGAGRLSPMPLGGFDLYRGNLLEGPTPYYNPVPFSSTDPDTQGVQFTIEASRRERRTLTLAEGSDYWTRQVLRNAGAQPRAFARRLLVKAAAALNRWEEGDNHSIPFLRGHLPLLRFPFFAYWLIMPLGTAGLITLAVRGDPRARILLVSVLAYGASMVLVFSNMRIRAPLMIILIPYAVVAVRELIVALRADWRRARGVGVAVAAFACLECLPVPGIGDLSAHYNTHGSALSALGRQEEAVFWWQRSSRAEGTYSAFADVSLASIAMNEGDHPKAWALLARVPDRSHAAALKYALAGNLLAVAGQRVEAAAAFELSMSLNTSQPSVVLQAVRVYDSINPQRARELRGHLKYLLQVYGPLAPPVEGLPSSRESP